MWYKCNNCGEVFNVSESALKRFEDAKFYAGQVGWSNMIQQGDSTYTMLDKMQEINKANLIASSVADPRECPHCGSSSTHKMSQSEIYSYNDKIEKQKRDEIAAAKEMAITAAKEAAKQAENKKRDKAFATPINPNASEEELTKRILNFIEDEEWYMAEHYVEHTLDMNSENYLLYYYKFLIINRCKNNGELAKKNICFDEKDRIASKIYKYADDSFKLEMEKHNISVIENVTIEGLKKNKNIKDVINSTNEKNVIALSQNEKFKERYIVEVIKKIKKVDSISSAVEYLLIINGIKGILSSNKGEIEGILVDFIIKNVNKLNISDINSEILPKTSKLEFNKKNELISELNLRKKDIINKEFDKKKILKSLFDSEKSSEIKKILEEVKSLKKECIEGDDSEHKLDELEEDAKKYIFEIANIIKERKQKEKERELEIKKQEEEKELKKQRIYGKGCNIILITIVLMLLFLVIIPMLKHNKLISMFNDRKYIDTYNTLKESKLFITEQDLLVKLLEKFIDEGQYIYAIECSRNITYLSDEQKNRLKDKVGLKAINEMNTIKDSGFDNLQYEKELVELPEDYFKNSYKLAPEMEKIPVVYYGSWYGNVIEWYVLKKENGKALLMSKYVIDAKKFFDKERYSITHREDDYGNSIADNNWEFSDIRKWLNENFYIIGFSPQEREKIVDSSIITKTYKYKEKGWEKDSDIENVTTIDKIFCFNEEEIKEYLKKFPYNTIALKSAITSGAKNDNFEGYDCYDWGTHYWLRDVGTGDDLVNIISHGYLRYDDYNSKVGIRPAMWVKYE